MARPAWHKALQGEITLRGGKYARTHRQGYSIWRLGRFEIGFAPSAPELEVRRIIRSWDSENGWMGTKPTKPSALPQDAQAVGIRAAITREEAQATQDAEPLHVSGDLPIAPGPARPVLLCRYPPCPSATGEPFKLAAHRARHEIARHGAQPMVKPSERIQGERRRGRPARGLPVTPVTSFERTALVLLHGTSQAVKDVIADAMATAQAAVEAKIQAMIEEKLTELSDNFRRVSVERDAAIRDRDEIAGRLSDIERAINASRAARKTLMEG